MFKELIEYQCPQCSGHFGALPECAGEEQTCSYCKMGFTIPGGLTPRLVSVSDSPGRPLTPKEDEAVRKWLERQQVAKPCVIGLLVKHYRSAFMEVLLALRGYWKRF